MAVTITKTSITIPTISNDAYPGTDDYLFSVVQGTAFSIDVTFALDDGMVPPVPVPITSVSSSLSGGYTSVSFTVMDTNPLAYRVRVSGTLTNVLTGESYQLLLNDGSLTTVSVSSLPAYRSITAWNLPTELYKSINNYSFSLNSGAEVITMNQYVYWAIDPSITAFKAVVAGGI
jgi:hypothetical protein